MTRQAATMADAVIDDEHDIDFLPYDGEEGAFESLPEDTDRRRVLEAEVQALAA